MVVESDLLGSRASPLKRPREEEASSSPPIWRGPEKTTLGTPQGISWSLGETGIPTEGALSGQSHDSTHPGLDGGVVTHSHGLQTATTSGQGGIRDSNNVDQGKDKWEAPVPPSGASPDSHLFEGVN